MRKRNKSFKLVSEIGDIKVVNWFTTGIILFVGRVFKLFKMHTLAHLETLDVEQAI